MSFARDEPYHAGNGRGGCQDAIVRAQSRAFSLSVRNTGEKRVVATRWQLRGKRCSATLGNVPASQGGCWDAQFHGISSSIRFWGQPLTRRVSKSAK
jgi:hypothetical protein